MKMHCLLPRGGRGATGLSAMIKQKGAAETAPFCLAPKVIAPVLGLVRYT